MRRNDFTSGILFGCLILFLGCAESIGTGPEIEWVTPSSSDALRPGDNLEIDVKLIDDHLVEGYEIWVQSGDGFDYYHNAVYLQMASNRIQYDFMMPHAIPDHVSIRITAWDDEGNKTNSSITLHAE